MKTKIFIDEDDPDRNEQEITFIKKLGEGNQAVVFLVKFQGDTYALKLVSSGIPVTKFRIVEIDQWIFWIISAIVTMSYILKIL